MEVYLDMLIFENLIMNYLILWVTAKFSKERTNFIRLIISSVIGALYATIMFFPSLRFIYTFLFKILLSFVLVVVAFYPSKLRQFIKLVAIFYIVSFVFGGAAFGLFYFTNFGTILSNGIFYVSNFPVKILLISSTVSYVIIRFAWSAVQNRLSKDNLFVMVGISVETKKINIKALIDTANSLYDPISNLPVMVVEYNAIKELLPEDLKEIFEKYKENDLALISNIISDSEWLTRFRLVPFSSLGKENGMLVGFKPDEVLIDMLEGKKEIKDIVIGIYNKRLSKDESYSALLHPEVISI